MQLQFSAGSPAHAGIDPMKLHCKKGHLRFPRTRGDRPPGQSQDGSAGRVPPHTRG